MKHHELNIHEISTLIDHLSNHLRLANKYNLVPNLIEVIKYLPIFTKVGDALPISLLPGNTNWYLLPQNEENSYGKIICPTSKGSFLNTSSQNLLYILKDIIKIPRLESYDYWQNYVIPFLESQQQTDRDNVIEKLFDRLPSLLDHNANLRNILGRISFVPVGTLTMSQQQQIPESIKLVKPTELFDPEERAVTDLFFKDEPVFPVGKYGVSRTLSSKSFFLNLKSLGMKTTLSSDDVIFRINTIVTRRQNSNVQDLIHTKAVKLFKYIDDIWNELTNNDRAFLNTVLEKEWIPTVDKFENNVFSKPQNCYCKKDKNLVCLVAPVLEYRAKNDNFLKHLKWYDGPNVDIVLRQLDVCYDSVAKKQPPKELKNICDAIYKYMSEQAEDIDYIKEKLTNKPWILCRDKFYSTDEVVFQLPNRFRGVDSLIVKFPQEYTNYKPLFKAIGVRDEIGVRDLILVIENVVKDDENKVLLEDEVENVFQILQQISRIQKDTRREGNNSEELAGLLIPSTGNKLVNLREIHFNDMEDRIDDDEIMQYIIAHRLITRDIANELGIQTLTGTIFGNFSILE